MPHSKEPLIDALSVAYLAAEGKTQMEIGRILNLSQSAVSRLYKNVRTTYIKTAFCEDKVSPDMLRKIQHRTCRHDLEDKLKELARKNGREGPMVHWIFMPEGSDPTPQVFAERAAPVVDKLLKGVRNRVGVAWGNILWETTQHLCSFVQAPWRKDTSPIEFIPLCGDPLVDIQDAMLYADRTSSRIASELSKIVNGDGPRSPWLGLVPAFIPRTFSEDEREVIDRLIDLVPYYGRIFGPRNPRRRHEPPLAGNLDMILTAAGDSQHPVRFGQGPLLQLGPKEAKELSEHIHGDIGGVLIPKLDEHPRKTASGQDLVEELTGLWTGLKMEHLKRCARQAFAEPGERPGVTLLGYRESLAGLACEAVRQGLVNHLIIGSPLGAAIEKVLAP